MPKAVIWPSKDFDFVLQKLAIENYRSIRSLTVELTALNLVTGANGSGKSNLYRALRLLADIPKGGVIAALAREGGLSSCFWAGPETISPRMKRGEIPIQGTVRQKVKRLKLGFVNDHFGYAITFGLPTPSFSLFSLDPEIKNEHIWSGSTCRPSSLLIDRSSNVIKAKHSKQWEVLHTTADVREGIFTQGLDANALPELFRLHHDISGWRFYDSFRTDRDAPARQSFIGTRTVSLHHDGHDIAAALQTIIEIGNQDALRHAIEAAFPDTKLNIHVAENGHFHFALSQKGMLRGLSASELSDGTLRYLLLVAALLTPRPPELIVLNEPEMGLHQSLIPALAQLIHHASTKTQLIVVSHNPILIEHLVRFPVCTHIKLLKELGQTVIDGQELEDRPSWSWPA